jgi:glycosyltransferase involved in cell wall biosynthesis
MKASLQKRKISLVAATLGRSDELRRLLDSLASQSFTNFEIVLVDQNSDKRVEEVTRIFGSQLDIHHVRCKPGLSRARNVGLQIASGDILGFPDDDCWYPPNLVERVVNFFEANPSVDGVSGRCIDEFGKDASRFDQNRGPIDRFNVWRRCVSAAMFVRRKVCDNVGSFDEGLGVGAGTPYWSGEETDYLLRALAHGYRILYDPHISIFHQQLVRSIDAAECVRGRAYARGTGRVLRKHSFPIWFTAYLITRSIGGTITSAVRMDFAKARFRLNVSIGRASGWFVSE